MSEVTVLTEIPRFKWQIDSCKFDQTLDSLSYCLDSMSQWLPRLSRRKLTPWRAKRALFQQQKGLTRMSKTFAAAAEAAAALDGGYPSSVGLTTVTQSHGVIDLRSDTVTLPTEEMRAAMAQ